MGNHEDNVVLPPTPGRSLSNSDSNSNQQQNKRMEKSNSAANKAKRRLEMSNNGNQEPKAAKKKKSGYKPSSIIQQIQKTLRPFTIPKKEKPLPKVPVKEQAPPPPRPLHNPPPPQQHLHNPPEIKKKKQPPPPGTPVLTPKDCNQPLAKRPKFDGPRIIDTGKSKPPNAIPTKTPSDISSSRKAAEDNHQARRLKTQAWARILKVKKKLYIPYTSDPRTHAMDQGTGAVPIKVEPEEKDLKPPNLTTTTALMMDKENSSAVINVMATATILRTPIKATDHNSIIRFMSMTPQLLSPLADHPGMFK